MWRKSAVVLILIFAMTLSACGDGIGLNFFSGNDEKEYVYVDSKEIIIPMHQLKTLNPLISKDEDTYYISKLIYEPLFELDATLRAEPVLVDSYNYSADKTYLSIKLKDGLLWQDGQDLTAYDVKFSIESYIKASYEGVGLYSNYVNNISKVIVSDSRNLQIYFKDYSDISLEKLTFPILPEHACGSYSSLRYKLDNFIPIGSGPYKFISYEAISGLKLEPNEKYQGEVPVNSISFTVVPNDADTFRMMELDTLSLDLAKNIDRDAMAHNVNVNIKDFPSNEAVFLAFNLDNPYLSDMNLRKAIAYAIDCENIRESAYYSNGELVDSLFFPGYMGSANGGDAYPLDLEEAKKLVNNFKLRYPEANPEFYFMTSWSDGEANAAAYIIMKNLEAIGITVYLEAVSPEDFANKFWSRDYQMALVDYTFADYFDIRFLLSANSWTPNGYNDAVVTNALDELKSGISSEAQLRCVESAKQELKDDLPYYAILYKTYGLAYSNAVIGESYPIFNNPYRALNALTLQYVKKINEEASKPVEIDESEEEN